MALIGGTSACHSSIMVSVGKNLDPILIHPEGIQAHGFHHNLYSPTTSTGAGKSRAGSRQEGRSGSGREEKPEVIYKWAEESLNCDHAEEGELRGGLQLCGQVLTSH